MFLCNQSSAFIAESLNNEVSSDVGTSEEKVVIVCDILKLERILKVTCPGSNLSYETRERK